METRTVEQVESWKTRSFADGFAGLRELSDGEFSGAVRAGGAWLFMLNGRIIGVYEGSLDDFENADGTAYAAPHPSLPLLFSMQAKGGDTRAKYYTNDTPLSEVDSTLTEGKFTGYIELSENVLSGDYYVAYYGGRSMSVAFVGAGEQVVTGDEAFERAEDEVGIYEVRDVEIEVTDVPEPDGADDPDPAASGPTGGASAGPPSGGGASESKSGAGQSSAGQSGAGQSGAGQSGADTKPESSAGDRQSSAGDRQEADASASSPSAEVDSTGESPASSTADAEAGQSATDGIRHPESDSNVTDSEASKSEASKSETSKDGASPSADTDKTSGGATGAKATSAGATSSEATRDADEQSESADSERDDGDDAFSEEQEWREATTIPSLDPDRSEGSDTSESPSSASASATKTTESRSKTGSATSTESTTKSGRGHSASTSTSPSGSASKSTTDSTRSESTGKSSPTSDSAPTSASNSPSDSSPATGTGVSAGTDTSTGSDSSEGGDDEAKGKIQKLRSQLKQRKQQVQKLKKRVSSVESERNEFERERNALRQEVERLEAKLETVSSAGSGARARQLDRAQAFDGTNLFVRYKSKGKATLEEAAKGEAEASDVNANLRLEHHTQFEADDVDVDGQPFEEFLTDSFEHRFVSWIIEDLLYEIQNTGHQGDLQNLYQSIPKIDRVDLHGSVSAGSDEEDTRTESFDVIMRDRMGNPLFVADLNDSRDPTTGDMMGSLVDAASGVSEAHDELSGAFQVTESFFQPEALETAESATTGGFLSREKRESFVKLSRKRGYHLCLVESRSGGFHLNVPEL